MGLCKCRKCGEVAPAKAWSAGPQAACPHCGHTEFSISFAPRPAPPAASPTPVPGQVDAHGRHRKALRLEDLQGKPPAASGKVGFHERMQALKGRPDKHDGDGE